MPIARPATGWSLHPKPLLPSQPGAGPLVFVVGAGMAGLCAGPHPARHRPGRDRVRSSPRTGGRTWTDEALGVPCDLGASWIHGADDNPLTDWCAAAGIPLAYTQIGTGASTRGRICAPTGPAAPLLARRRRGGVDSRRRPCARGAPPPQRAGRRPGQRRQSHLRERAPPRPGPAVPGVDGRR